MVKVLRLRLVYWIAKLVGVPIRVADGFWLKENVPSAKLSPQDGN